MSGSPDCFLTLSIQNQNFQEPKPQKTTTNTNQNVSLSLSLSLYSAIRMSNEVNFIISLIWVSPKWWDFLANYLLGRTVWYLYVPHVDCKSAAGLFLESHLVNTNYKLRWNKGPCERKTINWTSHGETKKGNSFASFRQQFILMEARITNMQSASQCGVVTNGQILTC